MDSIVKIHPIWAIMTFTIIFAPGLVLGVHLCNSATFSRLFHTERHFSFLVLLLTFCFPLGVLSSQLCEIFIVPFGSKTMITQIQFITELATGFEAFLESAPQIILQLYIIFISGQASQTQIITIFFSLVMVVKTTIMYDLMSETERKFINTFQYLVIHLPIYLFSGYFRLGAITLSCIFFSYWTVLPVVVLFFFLYQHANNEMQFSHADSGVLALSNLFVVS